MEAPTAQNELYGVMRRTYDELLELVDTPGFQLILEELYSLPETHRPGYVEDVILRPERLRDRGVIIPEEILVQRSSFGDRRPTLFCIKKYLPDGYREFWENVNITFDNDFIESLTVPKDERAWRKPLPIEVQALLMSVGMAPSDVGID
jgi:hypothetical protein